MTPEQRLHSHDADVIALQTAVRSGDFGLGTAPRAIKLVLERGSWRERRVEVTGDVARFASFAAFVTASLPDGLGTEVRALVRLCRDDPVVLDLIDKETGAPQGRPPAPPPGEKIDNVNVLRGTPNGNARQHALRSLRTKEPALHARVLTGELTAHGAMVQAGLRKVTVTVPLEPAAIARVLRRRLSAAARAELACLLLEETEG